MSDDPASPYNAGATVWNYEKEQIRVCGLWWALSVAMLMIIILEIMIRTQQCFPVCHFAPNIWRVLEWITTLCRLCNTQYFHFVCVVSVFTRPCSIWLSTGFVLHWSWSVWQALYHFNVRVCVWEQSLHLRLMFFTFCLCSLHLPTFSCEMAVATGMYVSISLFTWC